MQAHLLLLSKYSQTSSLPVLVPPSTTIGQALLTAQSLSSFPSNATREDWAVCSPLTIALPLTWESTLLSTAIQAFDKLLCGSRPTFPACLHPFPAPPSPHPLATLGSCPLPEKLTLPLLLAFGLWDALPSVSPVSSKCSFPGNIYGPPETIVPHVYSTQFDNPDQ